MKDWIADIIERVMGGRRYTVQFAQCESVPHTFQPHHTFQPNTEERGGKITNPLTTWPWGMRDFVVTDPDGNWLAIGERVAPLHA